MYLAIVLLLMLMLPILSIVVDMAWHTGNADFVFLVGKWFLFWGVGVRLLIAGIRQIADPSFTAKDIFGVEDPKARPMVQEIGFGNLSMGLLAMLSFLRPSWIIPAAIPGGLYFGLAGLLHALKSQRNTNENIAMVSDFWMFAVMAGFLIGVVAV